MLFAGILVLHGLLNSFGVRVVALLNNISVWWHILGVLVIVAVLAFTPSKHQSAGYVFGHFVNNTGWGSSFYVILLGLLLAQYTFTGYDASAHMTEETRDASTAGPRGIVMSIIVSLVAGWILLIGVTFAIQDYKGEAGATVPPAQIFVDSLGATGGKLLLLIVVIAQLFCGMASVTANSRMIYAFSRDGALPFSNFWHHINPRTRTPTNAIWLAAIGALILGLPYLWNSTAYAAVTSIAVIGLYVAYVLPTFLRLRLGGGVRARTVAPGPLVGAHRDRRRHVGRDHHHLVHAAHGVAGDVQVVQLHRDRGGRRPRLRRHLVAGLGPQLVHRPEGPGHPGGTGGHRGGAGLPRLTAQSRSPQSFPAERLRCAARRATAYSLRSTVAGRTRAARPPGQAAMRLASSKVAVAAARTSATGTSGRAETPTEPANSAHAQRPATTPAGRPMSNAAAASVVACHATARSTWERVQPSVLSMARSRRRRRTLVSSTCASAPMARTASTAPSARGVSRMPA